MGSYNQLKNLRKCKNKFRHKWIDEGGKERPIYCYKCKKCGAGKIKSSTYASSYYKDGIFVGMTAPECVAEKVCFLTLTDELNNIMRIIILEDTVFKVTEADFKKLMKMNDDFSKRQYYPAKEMEMNDFIETLKPNFKYVGVVQFDFRL